MRVLGIDVGDDLLGCWRRWLMPVHKPSQGWMSPTKVLAVRDVKLSARTRGRHLGRRRLIGPAGRMTA
jgi:hypothetical protein